MENGRLPDVATEPLIAPTPATYYRRLNSQRFTIELEFLSSLASPAYLVHLHSQGYLQSASFIRYLAYLHQTWSQPKYIKYLRYPNAIVMCKALVDNPEFREIVGRDGWETEVTKQIIRQWAGEQEILDEVNTGIAEIASKGIDETAPTTTNNTEMIEVKNEAKASE